MSEEPSTEDKPVVEPIHNTDFDSDNYGPPHNLGVAAEFDYTAKAYSEIWGINPETGEPNEYDINIKIATVGNWVYMHFDECIHPAHPIRQVYASEIPPTGTAGTYWDWDAPTKEQTSSYQWDYDSEVTGRPDYIHFKYALPSAIVTHGGFSSEYAVPIEVIHIEQAEKEVCNQTFTGTEIQNGRLVFTNTGVPTIYGNYKFVATEVEKLVDGQLVKHGKGIVRAQCLDCGRSDITYTKLGKVAGDPSTGFMVGYKSFCLILNLQGITYAEIEGSGQSTKFPTPTVNTTPNYKTCTGRDLMDWKNLVIDCNNDDKIKLKNTIAWYKDIFKRYKEYYDSLLKEEKITQVSMLYNSLMSYAAKWDKFSEYFKIEDYIPVKDDDSDGTPDHDEFGNALTSATMSSYSSRSSSSFMSVEP